MDTYIETMRDFWGRGTFCHTADRYNMVAQAECGLGLIASEDPLWRSAVDENHKMEWWPYNQGIIPGNCTEKYFHTSWTQIEAHRDKIN